MPSSELNLEKFLIPLEEIYRASQNFSSETLIGHGKFGKVYRGQLSERWQNRNAAVKRRDPKSDQGKEVFFNELELMSRFDHENIIPFIGYCDERGEMIIVTEYAINGSLDDHLKDPNKRRFLTWAQRLKICSRVATGLEYLHSGLGERGRVIQREPKSGNILLDENMEAKLCDFGLSILIPRNQPHDYDAAIAGTRYYIDPVYRESGLINAKTDTYVFGVVLFEMLTGMLAYHEKSFEDGTPLLHLMQWVRRYYEVGFEKLIDPDIRDQMDRISLNMVKEIAYKCISLNVKDRPTFDMIIKTIDRALDIYNHGAASIVRNIQHKTPNFFRIPLEEIKRATKNFSPETLIGRGRCGKVYTGQLSEHWQTRNAAIIRRDPAHFDGKEQFLNELELMSNFHHENIIQFIGYCDEGNEIIIVTEYAINGSLVDHLKDPNKRCCLTWAQRLKICLGVAAGLRYLHSGLGECGKVIQRDPKSRHILLDKNMDAKICDFGLSILIPRNQTHIYEPMVKGTRCYIDPVYGESGFLKPEADVYSFGVVMFELLSGMLAYKRSRKDVKPQLLMNLVRRNYDDERDRLVDPLIKDQVASQSLHDFTDLAYECISFDIKERPSMKRITKRIEALIDLQNHSITTIQNQQKQTLEDFLIPLKEIKMATNDFSSETQVGDGGFGEVHKGQLSERWNKGATVAIKILKNCDDEQNKDFLNELELISRFQHENIIPFVGYCDEGNKMIIVTDYAINGSLDCYLEDPEKRGRLTWTQRLKICLGAARGLNHLHSGLGKGNKVIHRDIKSANILLDDKLEARICDFGLSKLDLKNQSHTGIYTKRAGTEYYIDPVYQESGKLRTRSDVYSFGVVMFEMLSGMMAWNYKQFGDQGKPQHLISLVRRYYDAGGVEMLMDPLIKDQPYDTGTFRMFVHTAIECINMNYKERPTMETVIDRIEEALAYQAALPPI